VSLPSIPSPSLPDLPSPSAVVADIETMLGKEVANMKTAVSTLEAVLSTKNLATANTNVTTLSNVIGILAAVTTAALDAIKVAQAL
jgi:hypothetical protein